MIKIRVITMAIIMQVIIITQIRLLEFEDSSLGVGHFSSVVIN